MGSVLQSCCATSAAEIIGFLYKRTAAIFTEHLLHSTHK